jgi:nicotinamidase-related amidase
MEAPPSRIAQTTTRPILFTETVMNRQALIVGDVQRDFLEAGGALYCGDEARAILPRIRQLIDQFRREDALIVFVQDTHSPGDPEFRLWPPHCVRGTPGHELLPELGARPADMRIEKPHYSAFQRTKLADVLHESGIEDVHLTGVCTSICVLFTAADAFNGGFRVVVHRDAVADFDPNAHDFALHHMETILGANLV